MKKKKFSSIEKVISISKKGGMYILVDDENRENEGDLVFNASDVNSKKINFMAKNGRGLICLTLNKNQANKLGLTFMAPVNQSRNQTAFTVSIEAKKGITTGISAKDRSRTIKVATKKNVLKNEIVSPGHVFPIISRDGGVLVRAGHTEASVDIARLGNKIPAAVICEIMNEDGTMAKGEDLLKFANKHKLHIAKIEDLISYRLRKENFIKFKKKSTINLNNQEFNNVKNERISRINGNPPLNFPSYSNNQLKLIQDQYRRLRDLSIISFLGVYLIQIIDANVEAHLFLFDISENLGFQFKPYYQSGYQSNYFIPQLSINVKI